MPRVTIAEITADEEVWLELTETQKTKFVDKLADAADNVDSDFEDLEKSADLEVIEK